jgi:hypothetical protein
MNFSDLMLVVRSLAEGEDDKEPGRAAGGSAAMAAAVLPGPNAVVQGVICDKLRSG